MKDSRCSPNSEILTPQHSTTIRRSCVIIDFRLCSCELDPRTVRGPCNWMGTLQRQRESDSSTERPEAVLTETFESALLS